MVRHPLKGVSFSPDTLHLSRPVSSYSRDDRVKPNKPGNPAKTAGLNRTFGLRIAPSEERVYVDQTFDFLVIFDHAEGQLDL